MSQATATAFQPIDRVTPGKRLLRRKEVERITGKSRSAIYADIRAGTFPEPVAIGRNSVAWLEQEIDLWLNNRLADRQRNRIERAAPSHTQECHP